MATYSQSMARRESCYIMLKKSRRSLFRDPKTFIIFFNIYEKKNIATAITSIFYRENIKIRAPKELTMSFHGHLVCKVPFLSHDLSFR